MSTREQQKKVNFHISYCSRRLFQKISWTKVLRAPFLLFVVLSGTRDGIQKIYFAVATVYVLANVASIVSHVPGGLGVLEAVVIHVLPEASVIGALVVFRFIYFLVPFPIGAVLFAACELMQRRHGAFQS